MKKICKFIKLTLMRLFVNPCYHCVREYECEISYQRGFCGDWGLCFYEERGDTK